MMNYSLLMFTIYQEKGYVQTE